MGGALRAIGRVFRNIGDNLADIPISEIPWFALSWLGRAIARIFIASGRDIGDAAAAGLGLAFLVLLGIVTFGLLNWHRETLGQAPPIAGTDSGSGPVEPGKPWWE